MDRHELRKQDYSLSDDHVELRSSFRAFLATHCPIERVRAAEATGMDEQLWERLCGMGATTMALPSIWGGEDATLVDLTVVAEEIGRCRKTTTKPRSFLTAAQVHSLADESKHPDIVLLLATTGLRWGEMAALRVRDIDLGRGRIRVERSASKVNAKTIIGTTKTHAARSVAVSASVLTLLAPAMVGKSPDELLWRRSDGQPLRPPTTTHWFGAAVKRCQAADEKFPRVTVHELRHTAASLMIASGANVKTVQSQLGHKTATMTLDQYGHLFPDDLDNVADKMDDLVSGCAQNVPKKEAGQGQNTP